MYVRTTGSRTLFSNGVKKEEPFAIYPCKMEIKHGFCMAAMLLVCIFKTRDK
jgi:hypothetical protein